MLIKTRYAPTGRRASPERTCVGCGSRRPKPLLIRLVLGKECQPVVDRGQVAAGRGAYLCGKGCLAAAVKRKVFQRAFQGKVKRLDLKSLEAALEGSQRHGKETGS